MCRLLSVKKASPTRKDNLLDSHDENVVPDMLLHGYHERYYQKYTNKQILEKFHQKISLTYFRKRSREGAGAGKKGSTFFIKIG